VAGEVPGRAGGLRSFKGLRTGPGLTAVFLSALAGACTLAGPPAREAPGPSVHPPASTGEATRPQPAYPPATRARPSDGAVPSPEVAGLRAAVVETALDAIGTPYRWGGTGANGFDCSGLIQYAYGEYGIDLPRVSRDQLRMGSPVDWSTGALRPGDVLGFSAEVGGPPTHVGLYVGEGQFIHSSPRGVVVSDLREPYWQEHLMAARRMVR
jgi:cell wall-associated NlpC family hydrolase